MRLLAPLASVTALAALVGLSLGGTAAPARAAGDGYNIDAVHSAVLFRVKHLDVGYSYGWFNDVKGKLVLDEAKPEGSSIEVEVRTASVDTNDVKRDDHLRGPDFFNAAQFPQMTFKSTAVKGVDATHLEVTGDLTLHGKSKSITLTVEKTGAGKDPWGNVRVGFETVFTVKRSDFALGKPEGLGDEVRMTVAFEAIKG